MKVRILLVCFSWICLVSCKSGLHVFKSDSSHDLYKPGKSNYFTLLKIFHDSQNSTQVFIKLFPADYDQSEGITDPYTTIQGFIYPIDKDQVLSDSSSVRIKTTTNQIRSDVELNFRTSEGNIYLLKIVIKKPRRASEDLVYGYIDRKTPFNEQYFLPKYSISDKVIFPESINDSINLIVTSYKTDCKKMWMFFYPIDFVLPVNPNYPDTVIFDFEDYDKVIELEANPSYSINFREKGIYRFHVEEDPSQGFTLYNFGDSYPIVSTPDELVHPLAYITNIDSLFKSISEDRLLKIKLDQFWMNRAENIDRSRELIRMYYNRVIFANQYFTSFKQGWLTDRGMVYIIYGPPDEIVKNSSNERWLYSPVGIGPAIVFTFEHLSHPFSQNHFVLKRESAKFVNWDLMIDAWMNGQVYYYQNIEDAKR